MSLKVVRREEVTIVKQTIINGLVVAANIFKRKRNVQQRKDGTEYILEGGKKVELIKGVAVTGGETDPDAKLFPREQDSK